MRRLGVKHKPCGCQIVVYKENAWCSVSGSLRKVETEFLKAGEEGRLKGSVDDEVSFAYMVSDLSCSLLLSPLYRFSICLCFALSVSLTNINFKVSS